MALPLLLGSALLVATAWRALGKCDRAKAVFGLGCAELIRRVAPTLADSLLAWVKVAALSPMLADKLPTEPGWGTDSARMAQLARKAWPRVFAAQVVLFSLASEPRLVLA